MSGCSNATPGGSSSRAPARPSILLVTLDTTRAGASGPEAPGIETPSFNALVARGRRFLECRHPVLAERLKAAGYRTAASISSFVLSRRFGLQRGFDVFDDEPQAGASERSAPSRCSR